MRTLYKQLFKYLPKFYIQKVKYILIFKFYINIIIVYHSLKSAKFHFHYNKEIVIIIPR